MSQDSFENVRDLQARRPAGDRRQGRARGATSASRRSSRPTRPRRSSRGSMQHDFGTMGLALLEPHGALPRRRCGRQARRTAPRSAAAEATEAMEASSRRAGPKVALGRGIGTATFMIAWRFPNLRLRRRVLPTRFDSAAGRRAHVAANFDSWPQRAVGATRGRLHVRTGCWTAHDNTSTLGLRPATGCQRAF